MYAILIKLRDCRTVWTDTGIRTDRPEPAKREVRLRNPGCYVQAVQESDIAKMTGAAHG